MASEANGLTVWLKVCIKLKSCPTKCIHCSSELISVLATVVIISSFEQLFLLFLPVICLHVCILLYSWCALADTIRPEIQFCPPNRIREIPTGITSTVVYWTQPSATDNSGQTPSMQSTHTSGTNFGIGTTSVVYTFTDASSNAATCRFDVTVISGEKYNIIGKVQHL